MLILHSSLSFLLVPNTQEILPECIPDVTPPHSHSLVQAPKPHLPSAIVMPPLTYTSLQFCYHPSPISPLWFIEHTENLENTFHGPGMCLANLSECLLCYLAQGLHVSKPFPTMTAFYHRAQDEGQSSGHGLEALPMLAVPSSSATCLPLSQSL